MTAPEVEFLLDTVASVVTDQPAEHELRRVNRDTSRVYDGDGTLDMTTPQHRRTAPLEVANYVGVRSVGESPTPIGTEYDHDLEMTCSVRVEGMSAREHGHIDPDGDGGVVFDALCRALQRSVLAERSYPDVGRPDTTYHTLTVANVDDQAAEYADFSRAEWDVQFRGYETLP